MMGETETTLQKAIAREAKAPLEYTAFAMQAMQEGHPWSEHFKENVWNFATAFVSWQIAEPPVKDCLVESR